MTAVTLLDALRRHGATAYRVGDRLRLRPASAIPSDLLERLRQHKAALLRLVPEGDGAEGGDLLVSAPWHVVVDSCAPLPGPIRLDHCTTIIDPGRCIERDLGDLNVAVAHRNAGRDTIFARLVDEYVARLAACGCRVRVEAVS